MIQGGRGGNDHYSGAGAEKCAEPAAPRALTVAGGKEAGGAWVPWTCAPRTPASCCRTHSRRQACDNKPQKRA
eukprot:15456798-Alexandrium_andersonii.AAC.1